ncbi:unnamed protein product [Aureobasidium pullulans]|nr:unnamed protein product [Aureobasidium pullulans]CAD0043115.1 unnamed protein product [Aureobasidium pullulans]
MDSNIEFNGLRTQILGQFHADLSQNFHALTSYEENYRLISPANADALIIIDYRKKPQEELNELRYRGITNLSHHYCALLVTRPSKGNKVLAQGTDATMITPEASLRVLLEWTCENVAGVIAAKYK